jgi:hypothetical protein
MSAPRSFIIHHIRRATRRAPAITPTVSAVSASAMAASQGSISRNVQHPNFTQPFAAVPTPTPKRTEVFCCFFTKKQGLPSRA